VIGDRIKEERQRLGLNQTEFAALAGAAKRTQIDWEKGVSSPTAEQLGAMGGAGADVQYIVTGVRSSVALTPDERLLVERYRASPSPLKDAALRVLLGGETSGGAAQAFHGPVGGGVAGRDIVNKGRK